MLLRSCRALERLDNQRAALESDLVETKSGDFGIVTLEAFLQDERGVSVESDPEARADIERDLREHHEREESLQEQIATLDTAVNHHLSRCAILEDLLHEICVDSEEEEVRTALLRSLLPRISDGFLDQLLRDFATRQADREHHSTRMESQASIERIQQGLLRAREVVEEIRQMEPCPWQQPLSAEREVESFRQGLVIATKKRDTAMAALETERTASRARILRLCSLAKEALVHAGLLAEVEQLKVVDFPDGLEAGQKASLLEELQDARQAVSDARWKLDHVRKSYDERLQEFDGDHAAGRPTYVDFRESFDRQYFQDCNGATRYITMAEEEYNEVLKQAITANILPEDWDDWPDSELQDAQGLRYSATEPAVYLARLDQQRIERFRAAAGRLDTTQDPDKLTPSPAKKAFDPDLGSPDPEDSASQARFATSGYEKRIRKLELQRRQLREGLGDR